MTQSMTNAGMRWLMILAFAAALSACDSGERELQVYIDDVKARPGRPIEPLPEFKPPPSFEYEPGSRRSPFVSDRDLRRAAANPNAVPGPDPNRAREPLEQDPLDSLRMVGILSDARGTVGLVQDADGLVHRVRVGNFMGQNYGRITSVSESQIRLVEIVADGLGNFIERPAGIALSD
jgi:type IV pilus assembly protein PilP